MVPIIQTLAQLEKNYGREGAEILTDNCQDTIFGGFAPNSQTAEQLSKALGSRTVLSGSVSRSKNDPSQSLQMIFHGTLDTIPAGQRRFKRIFTQMPCVLLFLCLSPVLILFQEIRDLLWYRFMRPGAISNNEVWLTQCAEEDIRGLRDIQNTQKSTAFLSIKQKNILYLAKNA